MLLVALSQEKTTLLICIIAALLVHYAVALLATARLLRYKSKGFPDIVWHFVIQLGIILGPLVFLAIHPKRKLQLKTSWQVKPKDDETSSSEK